MIKVSCRSNLDLRPVESFPAELPCEPHVGQTIESGCKWPNGRLKLRIASVNWIVWPNSGGVGRKRNDPITNNQWILQIYLGPLDGESVAAFHERYKILQEPRYDTDQH